MTNEEWYATLDPDTRAKADKLLAILKRYGAADPLGWVGSEMRENFPQVARFLMLRQIRAVLDRLPFGNLPLAYKSAAAIKKTLDLPAIAQEGKDAFQRLVDAGANIEDILLVTRAVNVQAVLDMIRILDEGYKPVSEDETLGWALGETDNDEFTGRYINALHESILSLYDEDEQLQ